MGNLPEQIGFPTHFFNLAGLRLHAVVAGPDGAPLVVLLHGFPEFWYEWRHTIGPLAQAGFRIIVPDQRGYNLSDKAGPYDLRTVADDVAHLIAVAGYGSAHVVGHDWGGAVAWALAAWHPERLRRLAVINLPHPLAMADALARFNLRQYLRSWYVGFFQIPELPEWALSRNNFSLLKRGLRYSSRPGTFSDEELAHYVCAWSQPGALSATLGWYRAVWRSRRQVEESRARFERIAAPTLLLWGEKDVALGVELAEASVPHLANGRLVRYPESSHWLLAERPEEVNRQIVAHLTR
jgi:pimeloyl-ACP methyl ester carboxylesterase